MRKSTPDAMYSSTAVFHSFIRIFCSTFGIPLFHGLEISIIRTRTSGQISGMHIFTHRGTKSICFAAYAKPGSTCSDCTRKSIKFAVMVFTPEIISAPCFVPML